MKFHRLSSGFSLVEIALALGLLSFAVLLIYGLLPVSLQTNQESAERLEASCLYSLLVADLKHADFTKTESYVFRLSPLPLVEQQGRWTYQTDLSLDTGTTSAVYTRYLSRDGQPVENPADAFYRVSLRYIHSPGNAHQQRRLAPVEAHLTLSWPANVDPFQAGTRPRGLIENYLTFLPK